RRNFNSANGGASIGTMQEKAGVGTILERLPLSNTGNLLLRLDRNPATNVYIPYYSLTDGATWVKLKDIPAQVLNNARLAIQPGANVSGVPITADLAWVEVTH